MFVLELLTRIKYNVNIIFLSIGYSQTIIFLGVGELAWLTSGIELPGFLVNYPTKKWAYKTVKFEMCARNNYVIYCTYTTVPLQVWSSAIFFKLLLIYEWMNSLHFTFLWNKSRHFTFRFILRSRCQNFMILLIINRGKMMSGVLLLRIYYFNRNHIITWHSL